MPDAEKITVEDLDKAPADLSAPKTAVSLDEYEKLNAKHIEITTKYYDLYEKYNDLKADRETSKVLNELIRPFAYATFALMLLYWLVVAILLFQQAHGWLSHPMSDGVLQLLVGSTAGTVVGLVGMVLTGVFVGARKSR